MIPLTSVFLFSAGEGRSRHDREGLERHVTSWPETSTRLGFHHLHWEGEPAYHPWTTKITTSWSFLSRVQRKVIVNPRVLTEATGKMTSNKNHFPLKLHFFLIGHFHRSCTWAEVDRPLIWHQDGQSLQSFVRNILYRFNRRQCNKDTCFCRGLTYSIACVRGRQYMPHFTGL